MIAAPRVIQTSALFSGEVFVKLKLPTHVDEVNFNQSCVLHFENGAWIDRTANAPPRDFATCTVYARVSSLSAFAVVSPLTPFAGNVPIFGRLTSADGRSVSGALVKLTEANGQIRFAKSNPFGYFRFREVASGGFYTVGITSKKYRFSPQIMRIIEEIEDLNFVAQN